MSNYFNNSETNKADEEGKRWIKMADEMKPYRTMGQDPKSSSVTVTNASTSINTVKAKSALICASMEKKPLETFTEKSDPSPADVSKLNPKESVKPEHFMVSAVDADGKSHTVPKKPTLIDDALKLRSVENGQGVTGVPAVYTIYCEKYLDHLLQTGPPLSSLFPTTTFYESIPSEHHREVARMVGYLNEKLVAGKVITNVAALGLQAKYQQCRTAFEEKKELVESGIGLKEYNGMKMEIFELKEKVTEVEEQKKLMEKEFAEERAREKMTMDSLIDAVQEVTVHGGNLSEHTNELEDRVDQTKNKLFDFMEEHIESYKKTFSFLDDTPSEPVLSGRQLLGPDRWSSSEGEEDD